MAIGKYGVIYADPPWLYNDSRTHKSTGMARSAYECMPLFEIVDLPVQRLAADNCMLCLWVTLPKLQEGLDVIKAWGFKYITTGFVWVKTNPSGIGLYSGLGHWVNGNAELVLFGRKGMPMRKSKSVKQIVTEDDNEIIIYPRGAHSVKPHTVRTRIEDLFDGPYVELFAREEVDGWDVWGNDVPMGIDIWEGL